MFIEALVVFLNLITFCPLGINECVTPHVNATLSVLSMARLLAQSIMKSMLSVLVDVHENTFVPGHSTESVTMNEVTVGSAIVDSLKSTLLSALMSYLRALFSKPRSRKSTKLSALKSVLAQLSPATTDLPKQSLKISRSVLFATECTAKKLPLSSVTDPVPVWYPIIQILN